LYFPIECYVLVVSQRLESTLAAQRSLALWTFVDGFEVRPKLDRLGFGSEEIVDPKQIVGPKQQLIAFDVELR
jgi:hypothetical protein